MEWEKATDVILIASIAIFSIFVWLGLYQWIKRKSFMKIDKNLLWAILPFILMALTYFLFDKVFVLNTRPNGSGEPSFPSTHTMVVATIFLLTAIILPNYIKSKTARIILDTIILSSSVSRNPNEYTNKSDILFLSDKTKTISLYFSMTFHSFMFHVIIIAHDISSGFSSGNI